MTETKPVNVEITHRFVQTNGVRLHVAEAGDPAHPVVMLLHGFPEFWYGWHKQIGALVEAGFRVIAPDQRGYNLSEKPPQRDDYSLDKLSADIIGLLDEAGVEQAYLAGHDWGAAVAWWTAIQYPSRLKKMCILNVPHLSVMRRNMTTNPRQMIRSWYMGFFQIPVLPELMLSMGDSSGLGQMLIRASNPGSFTDADMALYTRAWKQPGTVKAMLNWYRSLIQRPTPLGMSSRVYLPTRIIWGAKDVALLREQADQSLEYCEHGELVVLENASHFVQHDEPERVSELLIDWFR